MTTSLYIGRLTSPTFTARSSVDDAAMRSFPRGLDIPVNRTPLIRPNVQQHRASAATTNGVTPSPHGRRRFVCEAKECWGSRDETCWLDGNGHIEAARYLLTRDSSVALLSVWAAGLFPVSFIWRQSMNSTQLLKATLVGALTVGGVSVASTAMAQMMQMTPEQHGCDRCAGLALAANEAAVREGRGSLTPRVHPPTTTTTR